MKYTAQDESRVANIALSGVLYLSQDSHQEPYILYKQSGSVLSVLSRLTVVSCGVKKKQAYVMNQ